MSLHCVRFSVRAMMAAVAVVILLLVALPEAVWVGHAIIPLSLSVLDASTGRPIEGASISLDENGPAYGGTTGPDGRVTIAIQAMTAGRSSLLRRTRSVNYHWALRVTAKGYEAVMEDLAKYTRDPRYHADAVPPPVVLRVNPVGSGQ